MLVKAIDLRTVAKDSLNLFRPLESEVTYEKLYVCVEMINITYDPLFSWAIVITSRYSYIWQYLGLGARPSTAALLSTYFLFAFR